MKRNTGRCYRYDGEREYRISYSKKYNEEHKDDPRFIEAKRRCGKNYRERCKVRKDVEMLGEFFVNDLSF